AVVTAQSGFHWSNKSKLKEADAQGTSGFGGHRMRWPQSPLFLDTVADGCGEGNSSKQGNADKGVCVAS
ncbi:hypothetical protein, partial [Pseudomonas syringae]